MTIKQLLYSLALLASTSQALVMATIQTPAEPTRFTMNMQNNNDFFASLPVSQPQYETTYFVIGDKEDNQYKVYFFHEAPSLQALYEETVIDNKDIARSDFAGALAFLTREWKKSVDCVYCPAVMIYKDKPVNFIFVLTHDVDSCKNAYQEFIKDYQ